MNTKAIGEVTEAQVLAALIRSGKSVLRPFGDNLRYDLLVDEGDGRFTRIQCKTARLHGDKLKFSACSSQWHLRTGKPKRDYRGQAEVFGLYCPETNRSYLVPVESVSRSSAIIAICKAHEI